MKRKLWIGLVLVLLTALLCCGAAMADVSGTCGDNLTWTLTDDGVLTISGTGDIPDYSSFANVPWEEYRSSVKSVVVDNGVTKIGKYAFYYCRNLEDVSIPSTVTEIGVVAFADCSSLAGVTIPASVSRIGYRAFRGCSNLTSANILNPDTVIGDSDYDVFQSCSSSFVLGGWEGSTAQTYAQNGEHEFKPLGALSGQCGDNVSWTFNPVSGRLDLTGTGPMRDYASSGANASPFMDNRLITSAVIGSGVTSIGANAFSNCTSLTSVTIGNGVTSIGNYAFIYCNSLTSITIPSSVTSIGSIPFSGCRKLTNIQVASGNSAFSSLNGVLYNKKKTVIITCPEGKTGSFTIPDSVKSIGADAFIGCNGLTSVTIPDSVTSIGNYAFIYCNSLTSITIPNSVTSIGENAFEYCTGLKSITIPNSVTSLGDYAFNQCASLTSATIGNGVTSIGQYVFEYCTGLKSITIPNSVTSIGKYAFYKCTSLTSVTIPGSVTSIGYSAFMSCSSLASVTILNPDAVIGDSDFDVFDGCPSSLVLHGLDPSTAKTYAVSTGITYESLPLLGHCGDGLSWRYIPSSGELIILGTGDMDSCSANQPWAGFLDGIFSVSIGDGVTSVGAFAFHNCSNMASVSFPDTLTEIDGAAFWNCSGLSEVKFPDSITELGATAFDGCSGLTSITIPAGLTVLRQQVFMFCTGLTSINIPVNVKTIVHDAFYECANLKDVTIYNMNAEVDKNAFIYCPSDLVIHGWPYSTAKTYANANGFAFQPLAVPDPDFFLPASLTAIDSEAFTGIQAKAPVIPKTVTSITGNPFADSDVQVIYGYYSSAADTFASNYGYYFIGIDDAWMASHKP